MTKLYYNNKEIQCNVIGLEGLEHGAIEVRVRPFSDEIYNLYYLKYDEYASGITINKGENQYYIAHLEEDYIEEGTYRIILTRFPNK